MTPSGIPTAVIAETNYQKQMSAEVKIQYELTVISKNKFEEAFLILESILKYLRTVIFAITCTSIFYNVAFKKSGKSYFSSFT